MALNDISLTDPQNIEAFVASDAEANLESDEMNNNMDKTQEKVMLILPVIFTFMFLGFPAGLVVYMIVNTVLSIVQQVWIKKSIAL